MRQVNSTWRDVVMSGCSRSAAAAQEAPATPSMQGGTRGSRRGPIDRRLQARAPVLLPGRSGWQSRAAGTTYFKGDVSAFFPPTAPTFRSYVGSFEYITPQGTLTMKEMGLTEPPASQPGQQRRRERVSSGRVGNGRFAGATGYLFVSGFNRNQTIVTTVKGEICKPAQVE